MGCIAKRGKYYDIVVRYESTRIQIGWKFQEISYQTLSTFTVLNVSGISKNPEVNNIIKAVGSSIHAPFSRFNNEAYGIYDLNYK